MTDIQPDFNLHLRRPFREQVAAFRLRLQQLVPTTRWDDIAGQAHDTAFMVAGAQKADLLSDLAGAVDKAIAEGRSLEEFRRDFRGIVERRGWHGWTGEGTKAGEAWRTRVIYRTNARTTYMAGRLAQLRKAGFRYWVYRHGASLEPREQHLAWDGLILPADHPFWETHFPPNGWGCSCKVFGAHTWNGALRLGGKPDLKLPSNWRSLDPRTGTPAGIDKGWAHAPGRTVSDTVADLSRKLDQLPPRPSIDLIQSWLGNQVFADWFARPKGSWPLVRIPDTAAQAIGATPRVAHLSEQTVRKQLEEHPELLWHDYSLAQLVVDEATEVIQDGPRSIVFVRAAPDALGHVLVVKATLTGEGLFVTSFRRLSADAVKRDRELRRLRRRGT